MSAQLYTRVARVLPLAPSQAIRARLVAAIQGKESIEQLAAADRELIESWEVALDSPIAADGVRMFSEEDHPRVTEGATSGQFTKKDEKKSSSSTSKQSKSGQATTPKKPRGPKVVIPTGSFGYDPASNHGTGYGVKGGDKNVHTLQQALNRLGFTDMRGKKLRDDGELGPLTTAAVKKAQKALGAKADGIVSPAFLKQLVAMKTAPKPKKTAAKVGRVLAELGFERKFDPGQPRDPDGKWSGLGAAVKGLGDLLGNAVMHHEGFGDGGFVAEHEDGSFTVGKPGGGLGAYIVDDDLDGFSSALDDASHGIAHGQSGHAEGGGWELDWDADGATLHGVDENDNDTSTRLTPGEVDGLQAAAASVQDQADGDAGDGGGSYPDWYAEKYGAIVADEPVAGTSLSYVADDSEGVHIARGDGADRTVPVELDDYDADELGGDLLDMAEDTAPSASHTYPHGTKITGTGNGGVRLDWPDGSSDELTADQARELGGLLHPPDEGDE